MVTMNDDYNNYNYNNKIKPPSNKIRPNTKGTPTLVLTLLQVGNANTKYIKKIAYIGINYRYGDIIMIWFYDIGASTRCDYIKE